MSFRWVLRDAPRNEIGTSEDFSSQDEAEDWMGKEYKRLVEDGSLAATLMKGEEALYTMKLTSD